MKVNNTGKGISIPVGEGTLGRIMDCSVARSTTRVRLIRKNCARSIRRRRPTTNCRLPVDRSRPASRLSILSARSPRAVRSGLFGGAGVGKTVNMMELINNIAKQHSVCRCLRAWRAYREGNDFYHEMKDSNVLDKVAMVFGQMNEPQGNRLRVALTGPHHGRAFPRRRP